MSSPPADSPSNPQAGPYADLDRPPLRASSLQTALVRPGSLWTRIQVVPETGSTNADLLAAAARGEPAGLVLVAEAQRAGRGRLDRTWVSPPRAGLTFSVLLRPSTPRRTWGWIPLLTGVALVEAIGGYAGLDVALRWPNDVLAADGRKVAGVLAESTGSPDGDAVVVGVGLNVTTREAELADLPLASSLALAGATAVDREPLLRAILRALEGRFTAWEENGGAPLADYPGVCATIGASARLRLPDGSTVTGTGTGVDAQGQLVLQTGGGERTFAAGDVEHAR